MYYNAAKIEKKQQRKHPRFNNTPRKPIQGIQGCCRRSST